MTDGPTASPAHDAAAEPTAPPVTDPPATELAVTEPAEPAVTEPAVAEPAVAEPAVAEPAVIEPAELATEPSVSTLPTLPALPALPTLQALPTTVEPLAAVVSSPEPAPAEPAAAASMGASPPAGASRPRRRGWWIVGVALLVAGAVAALALALGPDDSDGSPAGVADARAAVDDIIADASFARSTMHDIACPIDLDAVFRRAPDGSGLADIAGDGEFSAVLRPHGSQVAMVECSYEGEGAGNRAPAGDDGDGRLAGVSLGAIEIDTDFIAAMRSYLPSHDLTFAEPTVDRGGTRYAYCGEPKPDAAAQGFDAFCEVDHVDDEHRLVVGVFAAPSVLTELELAEWMENNLDEIVADLAG